MFKLPKFSFEVFCVVVLLVLLVAVRYQQFNSSLKKIEYDEFSWVITSFLHQHDIFAHEKGIWSLNDTLAEAYPTSTKTNQLSFRVFGPDLFSARKMLAVLNILSMVAFYFLCRRFLSPIVSFCTTILFSYSAYKLIGGRIAVEPAYADIFLYPFILFLLLLSDKNLRVLNYFYTLLAVLFMILGTFTYGLSFFFPVLGVILILVQLLRMKLKIKEKIFIFLLFIIPTLLVGPKWIDNIKIEAETKEYIRPNIALDYSNRRINLSTLYTNASIVYTNLFRRLDDRSADMVINYRDTIIPSLIVYLALAGIVLTLFKIKKYYSLYLWLAFVFGAMILFGFYSARMWVNVVGLLFIFAGLALQSILNLREVKNRKLTPLFLYFFLLFISYNSLYEYYEFAVNNPAFNEKTYELVEISKKYQHRLVKDIAFVAEQRYADANIQPAVAFYYLASHPDQAEKLREMKIEEMLVFGKKYFLENELENLNKYKIIVVDNEKIPEVWEYLKPEKGRKVEFERYENFTIFAS